MKTKFFRSTLAALAFAVVATSGSVASAGVASTAIGNSGVVNTQIGEITTSPTQVHYRYYAHEHPSYGSRRRSNYDDCRRVKERYWDGYGYRYRWVRKCN